MATYPFGAALAAVFVTGFLFGLLSFKVKSRWCPTCGTTTKSLEALKGIR